MKFVIRDLQPDSKFEAMKPLYSMKRLFAFSILMTGFCSLHSQQATTREFIRAIQEADSYFYYYYAADYEKAAILYEPLYSSNPENCNLAAKLGICYLNMDGRKKESLELLKKASANIAGNEKEYLEHGEKSPPDTYMYLGIAYHQNDSLEKALSIFNDYKKSLSGKDAFREEYIDLQIRNCRYALAQKKQPMRIVSELFAPWLSEYPGASNPVLAKNDSVFIFTQKQDQITRIFCSYKNGTWQRPVNITNQLGGLNRLYSNSITGNGKLLIIFLDDGADGNLYYSERTDTTWSKIKSLGNNINTVYWEAHGFITPDGKTIYFSSNRPGGEGGLDIWTSAKETDGTWGLPVNCGNEINTSYDENTPFYDPEANALYFSSVGQMSMGGYDIFRSVMRYDRWTRPIGMPYAFNTVGENTFFILNNNAPGFVTSRFDEKSGENNIYGISAINPADELSTAEGTITLQDGMEVNHKLTQIRVLNLKTKSEVKNIPVSESGTFKVDLKPGDYQIIVSHNGYITDTIDLNIPLYFLSHFISVNSSLIPEKAVSDNFIAIQNVLFDFDSYALTSETRSTLELIKNILINYPGLTIEVAGYTDAKGSSDYNQKLADKRAQSVIDYFISSGIASSRFLKKSFGESNFAAVNNNLDGTDNTDGRKYNRRVTFGIVDPQADVVLRWEAYTPEHLRQPYSTRYSIVLMKSEQRLSPGYFEELIKNNVLVLKQVKIDNYILHVLGVFYNKSEALKYLEYAKTKGLREAYIINQYDLENESEIILSPDYSKSSADNLLKRVYSIQLKATSNPLNINAVFQGLTGVREIKADDGFYKYFYGGYQSLAQAKESLLKVTGMGFPDAFIREINVPGK